MRNVFLFIRRYSTFLYFLVLQIIALSFLVRYNRFHQAAFLNSAGEITGIFSTRYNNVESYFKLKQVNDQLVIENARLNQYLRDNYERPDERGHLVIDTVMNDSLRMIQKYSYLAAKVVAGTVSTQTNYLTIHRGSDQEVRPHMGVVSPQGVVGTVVNVSRNYASVMTLLHRSYKVIVKLKKGGERGTIEWDGISPSFVTLKDIPKSAQVARGDSVVTSPTSSLFPGNIMVGIVDEIVDDKSSNFFTLKVRPATNFFNVEYVYVVANSQYTEQKTLEDSTGIKYQ